MYIERDLEDSEWLNLVYSERYDAFERLLGLKRRRLLDVGSGPGRFLQHGVERGGWTVQASSRRRRRRPTAAGSGSTSRRRS